MCCAAEADATAGDEEEESSNEDEVEEQLMTTPPLGIGAGALGCVWHKARRHQLKCGRLGGGEDEHTLRVPLLGSATHDSVVVSLLGGEPNPLLQCSSSPNKLVLGYSLQNSHKSKRSKRMETHLKTDVCICVDVNVRRWVASIS